MPVGTQAAVKTLTPDEVRATGSSIILANTYHLMLRPGIDTIKAAGSVHKFMSWDGPVLTDSGGFQVHSLSSRRKVEETGVVFRSHNDGSERDLTPESAIDLQTGFGSDVLMPLDELAGYNAGASEQRSAAERTQRWLARSIEHFATLNENNPDRPMLFGITQGGFNAELRIEHAARTAEREVDGFSIGGLSVGESKAEMMEMLDASVSELPIGSPRYLMGVGSPEDLWEAVSRGVDMFDCVHPTRVARRGSVFTEDGRVNLTAARFARSFVPVEESCDCYACANFTQAYIHHLFRAGEMLGPRLATIHNLRFFQRMMSRMRTAIRSGEFEQARNDFHARYRPVDEQVAQTQKARWAQRRQREKRRSRDGLR